MNNRSEAYDFTLFEPNTAPKTQDVPMPRLVKPKRMTKAEQRAQSREVSRKTLKVLSCALAVMLFLGSYIMASAKLDEINREIATVESNMKISLSENTRLKMELAAMASVDKVEEYAETKLGMVKAENYQQQYIELPSTDKVVLAGGESR